MDGSKNIEEKLKIGFPPIVLFAAYRYTATTKINKLKRKEKKKAQNNSCSESVRILVNIVDKRRHSYFPAE